MKKRILTIVLLIVTLFTANTVNAQAPTATPEEAITGLLNRIGGDGAANLFEIVIDADLAENGKDVFIIAPGNGKPCIKGNTQLSVATGINWYLNHYAHVNLTWNNLTTDLSKVDLPVPATEEKHVSSAAYRYDFNTCTFSYSMAFWTWERWQQEIDWMALHGINAPLNLVGLDVVTRKFLRELGVSESDINAYIAGPGFIAWFAMNNLEGWGGTIESQGTGVFMQGNPDWWYTRQENLCRDMLQRMRELGMQPVIPGFSGQVPNCIVNYTIDGFSSGDVVNNGSWAGGYTRPDILKPNTTSYQTFATVYYKHLHEVMGVSELYSIDPFHEGSLPGGVTNETCYPNIMKELDKHFGNVEQSVKDSYKVTKSPSWIIQYWQGVPQSGAFTAMKNAGYTNRFIGLDLFADNIYADNAAKWRTNYYDTCPYIYCMLHNFGGRSGLHGRLETTMGGYFQALAKNNNCQGIGATPEGTETNPILYDMLFELPWMNSNPGADAWLTEYAHSRYGVDSKTAPAALEALKNLKKSVWDCKVNQQGTSEAVILARPNWTIGSVSSWSTSAIYWDTQDVLLAADQLYSVKDLVTANGGEDGIANYNYDFIDVVRQAMVDYAAQLLPLINAARGNDAEYTRLYQLYLQLMLDLDEMLSYDENFKLERWTSLARNIADEVEGTTENDRNWLEWNARTQVTVWSKGNTDLHDYSNRCWAGLIKDFHYKRWEKFFTTKGGSFDGGWFSGFEYPWTVDFNDTYNLAGDYSKVVIPTDMTATEKAAQTFGNYFGRVKGATKNYIFPMGVATNATKSDVISEVYRGQEVELPLIIGKNVTISSVWIDLNADGNAGNGETLTANGNSVTIPADAAIGKTTAKVTYSDGTVITFNLALIEDITDARTVTAVAGANGSVAIEGTSELSISTTEAVKITATANTGYNFENWTKDGEVVSNDNPFIYYGKEAATFTANFIQDKWGVPSMTAGGLSEAVTNNQYVSKIDFAYHNREAETIYDATSAAPTSLFTTIPQIIDVPQGASFTITWTDNGTQNLTKCFMSAYMDFDGDGNFEEEGELVKVVGTRNADNSAVRSGSFQVILPYDAPTGITHLRMRFDSAWGNQYNSTTKAFNSKGELNRMCYEIVLNITEKSNKAATINVETNSADWGTVEVWTDETPDGSTGTEWVVSANIPMYLRATKTSEDVEFLGWYDHYGRLLTTELEYSMLAREDATYTARFRKFLEIDGWQIEYRTQPGKDVVTTKLAKGVKPEAGKKYYIAADAKQSDGSFVSHYLYDNGSALKTATSVNGDNYLWTCIVNSDGTYSFQNASGKYLANNNDYHLSVGATPAKYAFETANAGSGVALTNVSDGYTGSKWMVTKFDGSAFNKNSVSVNNGSWCNDYIFVEVSTPDVVILTNVRKSGDHDLVIPETVEILGEQCKIVGFDNNLFKDNKDLWTISLPATIEELSNNKVFTGVVKGKGADQANQAGDYVETPLNTTLVGEDWQISLTIEDNGNNFSQWGSALVATGSKPMENTYYDGFQLYMKADGTLIVKIDNSNDTHTLTSISKNSKYRIDIVYTHANTQLVVTATSLESAAAIAASRSAAARATNSLTLTQELSSFSIVSHAIPEGVNITNLEVRKGAEPDPFEGCINLCDIEVADGCESYYVDDETRTLKSTGGTELHTLPDEEKANEIRALGELIDLTKAMIAEVATNVNPTGKETEVALTTTLNNDYYIWCNNPHTSGNDGAGGVAALLDEDAGSYLHSNWDASTKSTTHDYLQIDFGNAIGLDNFKIAGQQRSGASDDYPKNIEIYGSNDNSNWTPITTVEELPNKSGATWTSGAITTTERYSHLKFVVKTHNNYNETSPLDRPYFHMAKFDLFKLTSSAEVKNFYANLAGIKAEDVESVYDSMTEALYYYNNGGTADELQAANTALQEAYDELVALLKAAFPVELTLDEANPVLYKINFKRGENAFMQFREDNNNVKLTNNNNTANATYYTFYFMSSENGVLIKPYNADGKVLGTEDITNGHTKISAVDINTENYVYEWTFVPQSDGYYNIKITKGSSSNYMSDFGNYGADTGFYGSNNSSDAGSLFKFIKVAFDNNNPRFYQLSDFKATTTIDGTNIYGGTSVGLYTGGKEYREAYTAAKELIEAGNTSDSDACHNTYKALRAANENLSYNEADPEKLYYIVSTATSAYCKGQYVHTYYELQPSHNNYDHKDLVYHNFNNISTKALAAFQFIPTGTPGGYKMKNLHTGLYVKSFGKNADHLGSAEEAQEVKIAGIADGQVTLKIGSNDPMHAQDDNDCIVSWGAEAGNASTWTINEVTNLEDIAYYANVSELKHSTLYLNYPVVIPNGIDAYIASEMVENGNNPYIHMEEITGIIPARTAVVLYGEEGEYPLHYTVSNAEQPTNLLKGTLWKETISKENGFEYYILANGDKGVGMYIPTNADNESQFINRANKAYLEYEKSVTPIAAFSFRGIIGGGTTDIDEINSKNEEAKAIYDLQGRKLKEITTPGIYIINNRKVVVK